MPKRVVPLSDAQCKNAKPKEKPYKLGDGGGLYLWVTPANNKLWRMNYRFPKNGSQKTISFGEYPYVSLEEARDYRGNAKKLLANNLDPMDVKKEEMRALREDVGNTFQDVALKWFDFSKDRWTERNAGYVSNFIIRGFTN